MAKLAGCLRETLHFQLGVGIRSRKTGGARKGPEEKHSAAAGGITMISTRAKYVLDLTWAKFVILLLFIRVCHVAMPCMQLGFPRSLARRQDEGIGVAGHLDTPGSVECSFQSEKIPKKMGEIQYVPCGFRKYWIQMDGIRKGSHPFSRHSPIHEFSEDCPLSLMPSMGV